MPEKVLKLRIDLDDGQAEGTLARVERNLGLVEARGKTAALSASVFTKELANLNTGGRAAVVTTADMERQLGRTASSAGVLQGAVGTAAGVIAGVFTAQALIGAIKATIDWGDQLESLSNRTDMSVEALQAFEAAARRNRTSLDAVVNASDTLAVRLTSGEGSVEQSLRRVGLSLEQALRMNAEDRLLAIANGYQKIQDPVEQARVRFDLFGRSGREIAGLLNSDLNKAFENHIGISKKTAEAMSDLDNMFSDAVTAGKAFIADTIAPMSQVFRGLGEGDLPKATAGLVDFVQELNTAGRAMKDATGLSFSQEWRNMMETLWDFGENPKVGTPQPLPIAAAFEGAAFNAKELLNIEKDLTKQSEELDKAWQKARDHFFGADVLRDAEEDLKYITNVNEVAKMSPAAFDGFLDVLRKAKAYLDQVGDSASTEAGKIRSMLDAIEARLAQTRAAFAALEGSIPQIAPGDLFKGNMGIPGYEPFGTPLPGEIEPPPDLEAEWRRIAEEEQKAAEENRKYNEGLNQTQDQTKKITEDHASMTQNIVSNWISIGNEALKTSQIVAQAMSVIYPANVGYIGGYYSPNGWISSNPTSGPMRFSEGGYVAPFFSRSARYFGYGGPSGTDTVPAWLTPGEGVLSRRGMSALDRLNSGRTVGGGLTIAAGAIVIHATAGQDPEAIAAVVEQKFVQLTSSYLAGRV